MATKLYLGFGKKLDAANVVSLRRQYLPLGKVGGKPAWLNPASLPKVEMISCKCCKKVMPMLLQIYCSADLENAFHRYIYVFMCPNDGCQKIGSSDNFRVLRCQLPRQNDFLSYDKPINFEQEGEVDDPYYDAEKFAKLCNVCGALGTKQCGRCLCTWYCSKDHQVIDWKEKHKLCCQEGKVVDLPKPENQVFAAVKENAFLFEEYGIEMDEEEAFEDEPTGDDEDDDDEEIEDEKMRQELLNKAQGLMNNFDPKNEMNELNELDECEKDENYIRFEKVLKRSRYQMLRYNRGGKPLLATDHAKPPGDVPSCSNCGARRQYEFQLMPHLLSLIDIDDISNKVDFATVLIYTCSADCDINDFGYAEEFAFKQDFIFTNDNVMSAGEPMEE